MAAPARRLVPVNGARAATIRQPPMPALTNASCPEPNSPGLALGVAHNKSAGAYVRRNVVSLGSATAGGPRGCPGGEALAGELLAVRGGPTGGESRGAGHHDDLMTAVALALWAQALMRQGGSDRNGVHAGHRN